MNHTQSIKFLLHTFLFSAVIFSLSYCDKFSNSAKTPIRKIDLTEYLRSTEIKKFSVDLAQGNIDVKVIQVPPYPKNISFVLSKDDSTVYLLKGKMHVDFNDGSRLKLEEGNLLYIPMGTPMILSGIGTEAKFLFVKGTENREIEFFQPTQENL